MLDIEFYRRLLNECPLMSLDMIKSAGRPRLSTREKKQWNANAESLIRQLLESGHFFQLPSYWDYPILADKYDGKILLPDKVPENEQFIFHCCPRNDHDRKAKRSSMYSRKSTYEDPSAWRRNELGRFSLICHESKKAIFYNYFKALGSEPLAYGLALSTFRLRFLEHKWEPIDSCPPKHHRYIDEYRGDAILANDFVVLTSFYPEQWHASPDKFKVYLSQLQSRLNGKKPIMISAFGFGGLDEIMPDRVFDWVIEPETLENQICN